MANGKIGKWIKVAFILIPMVIVIIWRIDFESKKTDEFTMLSFVVGEHESQEIKSWKDKEVYYIFLPTETAIVKLGIPNGWKLILDEDEYLCNESIDLEYNVEYEARILSRNEKELTKGKLVFFKADSVPSVYIEANCEDTDLIVRDKTEKIGARLVSISGDNNIDFDGYCIIEGRGNTSWDKSKKPYNLELQENSSLFGMKAMKKWALLGNGADDSLLRNKIAVTLAEKSGCKYTPEMKYINLYVNGVYQGGYLLTQRISTSGGCILWDEKEANILLERDARYKDSDIWFETNYCGVVYDFTGDVKLEDIKEIEYRLEAFEKNLYEQANDEILDSMKSIIDVEAYIRQYMIAEFLANADMDFASCFYYMPENEKVLFAGPIWDYDRSMGIISSVDGKVSPSIIKYEDVTNGYLAQLMNYEDFKKNFIEYYYNEFEDLVYELQNEELPEYIEQLRKSMRMNEIRWGEYTDFNEDSEQVVEWIEERRKFLSSYWANPDEYCKVVCSGGGGTYYYKKNSELTFLPCLKNWEKEDIIWTDVSGKVVEEGFVITEDMTLHAKHRNE